MTRPKKEDEVKFMRTGFSYPPEMDPKIKALAKKRRLSDIIRRAIDQAEI